MIQRLIIIGAGAVGGSIGGLLMAAGFPVALVARDKHGAAIQNDGLKVRTPNRTLHIHPPCFSSIDQVEWREGDVAILATKLQDFESVLDSLSSSAGDEIPVVCATNGIHGERWAKAQFDTVLSTLVWMPATYLQPGEVRLHSGECPGVLDTGPRQGVEASELCEAFCQVLRESGFDAQSRNDIQRWKIAKWITNLGSAAQAMVTDDWQSVAKAAQAEGESVLSKANVSRVTNEELLDRCRHIQEKPIDGQVRGGGSTWQSRQRGRTLESRWIEGAMADLADEIGEQAPVNRFLSDVSQDPRPLLAAEVLGRS